MRRTYGQAKSKLHERGQAEKVVFETFVEVSRLRVNLSSVENRQPPEPDIRCEIYGEGAVAFELGEVLGREFASYTYERPALRRRFRDSYNELPVEIRAEIQARIGGHPAIFVAFLQGTPPGQWRKAIKPIIETLAEMRGTLSEGKIPVWRLPRLRAVLSAMQVRRGTGDGPSLHVMEASLYVNPTLDLLQSKFRKSKSYYSDVPVELLAYYATQLPPRDSSWLAEVEQFVRQNIADSCFRRVWLFDFLHRRVMLAIPRPT